MPRGGFRVALVRDRADILLKKAEAEELHELLAQQARIRFNARHRCRGDQLVATEPACPSDGSAGSRPESCRGAARAPAPLLTQAGRRTSVRSASDNAAALLRPGRAQAVDNAVSARRRPCDVPHYGQPVLHPAEQVRRYCQHSSTSHPCSRRPRRRPRHRLPAQRRRGGLATPQYRLDEFGRLYTRDERSDFIDRADGVLDTDRALAPAGAQPPTTCSPPDGAVAATARPCRRPR